MFLCHQQAAEVMRQIRDEERAGRGALFFVGKMVMLIFYAFIMLYNMTIEAIVVHISLLIEVNFKAAVQCSTMQVLPSRCMKHVGSSCSTKIGLLCENFNNSR